MSSPFQISAGEMPLGQLHRHITATLAARYDMGEARAQSFILLEDAFGVARLDVYADKVRYFSSDECQRLLSILQSLGEGVPLQYALGEAKFCGRTFFVDPSTLIPRPETEELVHWCVAEVDRAFGSSQAQHALPGSGEQYTLLDVGTGSGCIAISLALALGAEWQVQAWDISPAALDVARRNALRHGATVDFRQQDALDTSAVSDRYHVIVSNPPYICDSERNEMASHVLDHEPHAALFVPDADPMQFYRALAQLARRTLMPGGLLMVEINRAYAAETMAVFEQAGLTDATLRYDAYGNPRMVLAWQPH
jgi:release factor glutamine methyltransferase